MIRVLSCLPGLLILTILGPLSAQSPDPKSLEFRDGTDALPDRATYDRLSYQGPEVMIDTGLIGIQYVKYQIEEVSSDQPKLYFINTKTHRSHPGFMRAIGIGGGRGGRRGFGGPGGGGDRMRGVLAFRPFQKSPNGMPGLYTIEYEPNDSYPFAKVKLSIDLLVSKAPFLEGRIAYYPLPRAEARYRSEKKLYDAAQIPGFFPRDAYKDVVFLPLNQATGYGRLRLMSLDERPSPRDVVLYKTLPNEMPRVAGIITAVRQTPLSHVNLRAVQDRVPNSFIADAESHPQIRKLLGRNVFYRVHKNGFEIRAATDAEIDRHFAALRPAMAPKLRRDLTVKECRALDDLGFADAASVGVKAANVAVLRSLNFGDDVVPGGFAIPFAVFDAFMRHNGLYQRAAAMRRAPGFATDADTRVKELKAFRKLVRKGEMPGWAHTALSRVQQSFSGETKIRCRSSTNNEDLPGFSGAGLYDSFTHRPDEGHLEKSIKQVYASLWNFRAYEEREFYRVDHLQTAMAVLCHANFAGEKANGVAVSDDMVYQSTGKYYVNVQVGEDLVTNPEGQSVPEEWLLGRSSGRDDTLVQTSNRVEDGEEVLSREHRDALRRMLGRIKRKFRRLYGHKRSMGPFAMEIEFKITAAGKLAIKQARPWVF